MTDVLLMPPVSLASLSMQVVRSGHHLGYDEEYTNHEETDIECAVAHARSRRTRMLQAASSALRLPLYRVHLLELQVGQIRSINQSTLLY